MGWFSPVKGSYPSLAQVDKSLPVASAAIKIERGMIVALTSGDGSDTQKDGVWSLPTADDKLLYVALTDSTDPTAAFAGTGFDPKGDGVPLITALDLGQDAEYETTMFDGDAAAPYEVGAALYATATGLLSTAQSGEVVGYVTRAPATRWINNAIAVNPNEKDPRLAVRTGATLSVLRFKTK